MREQEHQQRQELLDGAVPGSKPPRPPASYAGTYESCLFGPIHVRREAEGWTLQMGEGQEAELVHHHGDSFLVLWQDPLYRQERSTLVSFDFGNAAARKLSMQVGRDQIEATAAPLPPVKRTAAPPPRRAATRP